MTIKSKSDTITIRYQHNRCFASESDFQREAVFIGRRFVSSIGFALVIDFMRRGKEFYTQNYEAAMDLHKKGLSARDIAKRLGISYSCVYHWTRGLRKPAEGNLLRFYEFLKDSPKPVAVIEKRFSKHNELFLTSARRGLQIKRKTLPRKFGKFATWYFLDGQEQELSLRITEMMNKYKELRKKLFDELNFFEI